MNSVKDHYRDISPVTLHIAEENVTSSLYSSTVNGIDAPVGTLVECFLVEVYRCKVCQFTSALKSNINSHLVESHDVETATPYPSLPCLEKDNGEGLGDLRVVDGEDELDQSDSPYNLEEELSGSKHSDDDPMDHMGLERMSFLLPMYGMLPNISPRSCDMGLGSNADGSLHVAQTCEVSTLFEEEEELHDEEGEEENAMFQLKGGSVDLPCPLALREKQDEETAQSAHLMTLGLCRISTAKASAGTPKPSSRRLCSAAAGPEGLDASLEEKTQQQPAYEHWRTSARCQKTAKGGTLRRTLQCILCASALPSKHLLEVHIKSHDGDQGFKCPRCGWRAGSWKEMELHWKNHWKRKRRRWEREKEKGSRPFSCRVCLRTFRSTRSRDAHEQKHAQTLRPRESFKCSHCPHTDKSRDRLYKHILSKHKALGDKRTGRLDKLSPSKEDRNYKDHLQDSQAEKLEMWRKSRNGELKGKSGGKDEDEEEEKEKDKKETLAKNKGRKEFCCALCNRKFSTKLTMRRHMGIHQGEKPYDCPHCDYSTRLKASLVQHIRVHTGEKPFKCPHCPYASIDSSSLRRHSRTHTQEKPYKCQYCSYSSIQKKSLDLHARRHHTGESYPCHLCQYSSPDRQLLLRHVRKHHTSQQPLSYGQQPLPKCSDNPSTMTGMQI